PTPISPPTPSTTLFRSTLAALRTRFDQQHKAMFGHMAPEEPVEIVSYRVRGIGIVPQVEMPKFAPTGGTLSHALRATRTVRFDGDRKSTRLNSSHVSSS